MRKLALTAGVVLALSGGVAVAQFVDPRTAAGAAGVIMGSPTAEETPVAVDPSRDPSRERAGSSLGRAAAEAGVRGQTQGAAPAQGREVVTTAEDAAAPVIDGAPTAPSPRTLTVPPGAATDRPR